MRCIAPTSLTPLPVSGWIPPRMRFSVSFVRGTAIEPGMRCRRPRGVEIGIKSSRRTIDSISNQLLFPNQRRRLGDRENSEEQNWRGKEGGGVQVNLYPHLTEPNTHGTAPPQAGGVDDRMSGCHGRVTGSRLSIGTAQQFRSAGHFELCSP